MDLDLTYEKAMEELSDIVEKMSSASVPLDELMKLYERGMALTAHCEKLLNGYEAKLEQISKRIDTAEKE
ncbi:MAG: exodeoxyribonuclease VII small subunit [Clostridiales bacterium]|nr:exodeoxyribonuclease VII small subunit [Clostridiales bacterium]